METNVLKKLLGSKRAVIALIAVLGAVVQASLGFASWAETMDLIHQAALILMGLYGIEDAATAFGKKK